MARWLFRIVFGVAAVGSVSAWVGSYIGHDASLGPFDDLVVERGFFVTRGVATLRWTRCPDCKASSGHEPTCKWDGIQVCEVHPVSHVQFAGFRWRERAAADRQWFVLSIPFWFPTLLFSGLAIWTPVWWWRRRRRGLCTKCEYDLTGNISGICPECGTALSGQKESSLGREPQLDPVEDQ